MISIDEMTIMLDKIAAEFPPEIYNELNGGILLLPESKLNPAARNNDLYIMGEYCRSSSMGRYITIYYGSFERVYGHLSREALRKQLEHTLKHEFTHHLESLAGEKDLEIKDAQYIKKYLDHSNKG